MRGACNAYVLRPTPQLATTTGAMEKDLMVVVKTRVGEAAALWKFIEEAREVANLAINENVKLLATTVPEHFPSEPAVDSTGSLQTGSTASME